MVKNMLIETMKFIVIMIPVLMSIAYLTLSESKMLGYSQLSKGPNVVGLYGLLQPLADGVKLFSKELITPNHVNLLIYFFSPILAFLLSLVLWVVFPFSINSSLIDFQLSMVFVFFISSLGVYAILLSGWSSNSKYAFLGSLSAAAQMISYEVSLGIIVFSVIIISGSLNFFSMIESQVQSIWLLIPLWPMSIMFFISCLAETNSAPFDLTEGESELVSGFNIEYSAMSFALFFLAEYSHIMFMSLLFCICFLGGNQFLLLPKGMLFMFSFLWVSTSFPSLSYDQLMSLMWKSFLPLSISFMILTNSILWSYWGLSMTKCL